MNGGIRRNQDGKTALSAVKGGVCTSAPVAATRNLYTGAAMPHTHTHICDHTSAFTYPHSHNAQDAYVAFVFPLSHLRSALTPGCSFVPEISYNTTAHSPRIWIAPRISEGHNNRHTAQLSFFQIAVSHRGEFPRGAVNVTTPFESPAWPPSSFTTCAVRLGLVHLRGAALCYIRIGMAFSPAFE